MTAATTDKTAHDESRKLEVAQQIVAIGRSLRAFDFNGQQYLSKPISETMKAAERAFAADDYNQAEHLAKIVAYLVQREAPKFAANPKAWIEARHWRQATLCQESFWP
jgi:phytoene/squalene synthetase